MRGHFGFGAPVQSDYGKTFFLVLCHIIYCAVIHVNSGWNKTQVYKITFCKSYSGERGGGSL